MPIKTLLAIASLIASFVIGCWFSNEGWEKKWAEEKSARAAEVATLSEQYRSKESELAKHAQELDQKYTQDLLVAERRIDSLELDLATNAKRLRIRATCPSAVPQASGSKPVGDAGAPTLDAGAEQAYLRLRRGIEVQDAQIRYLQEYINEQCLRPI